MFKDNKLNIDLDEMVGIEKASTNIDAQDEMAKKLFGIKDLMESYLPAIKSEVATDEICKYKECVSQYFADMGKTIEIKPSGITIKTKGCIPVDLLNISSGEKKILMIFAAAIFLDGVLFMDEPELSLSLPWQEKLVPDILEVGKSDKLLIATHSPFIVRNSSLMNSIVFLPQTDE